MLEVTSPCWRSYPDARGHVTMPEVTSQHCRSLRFHSVLKHVQVNTFIWAENGGSFLFLPLLQSPPCILFRCKPCSLHFHEREERKNCRFFVAHLFLGSSPILPLRYLRLTRK